MEEIFSNIKKSAASAVKKSGELLEITKTKMAISDTKSELKSNFAVLGKLVYEAQKNEKDFSDEAEEIIWEIDELYEVLEAREARLAALTNQKVCPDCGKVCEKEAAFCSRCGKEYPLVDEEEEEADE
ncbi:MAG: zinc ribbon domain-containing protein [Clostridia bacterium]|nr:zinc ribbon domain-containing protein [Clostridia bacterium]MBQ3553587.1 zinc ribbon domain-containing protein [Clostridia bacterium]